MLASCTGDTVTGGEKEVEGPRHRPLRRRNGSWSLTTLLAGQCVGRTCVVVRQERDFRGPACSQPMRPWRLESGCSPGMCPPRQACLSTAGCGRSCGCNPAYTVNGSLCSHPTRSVPPRKQPTRKKCPHDDGCAHAVCGCDTACPGWSLPSAWR